MPKCRKRRICREPVYTVFQNEEGSDEVILLTADEYEAIRLIDREGLSQSECAVRLNVARTTAQLIYNTARKKIADSIVLGKALQIGGGNYTVCDGSLSCRDCYRNVQPEKVVDDKGDGIMRIAVTYEGGNVFQHFGKSAQFKIYDVEDKKVKTSQVVDTNGAGHGALAGFLKENQADVVICGGIGGGAQNALAEAGITLCAGASGNTDAAVEAYIKGELVSAGVTCDHHGHGEGHTCREHGCGEHH